MPKKRPNRYQLTTRGKAARWYCRFYVDGVQKTARLLNAAGKPCANRAEAEAAAELLTAPLGAKDRAEQLGRLRHALTKAEDRAAELIEDARPRLKIVDAWEAYLAAPNRPQSGNLTLTDFEQRWGKFVRWACAAGIEDMEAVTPEHAGRFAGTLSDLSPNRFNKIIQTGRLVFATLERTCAGMRNPFEPKDIRRKKPATQNRKNLTTEELQTVIDAADGELRRLILVGACTGLRLHDAVLLDWGEIDLARGIVKLTPRKTAAIKPESIVIPILRELRAALEEIPPADRRGYVMPTLAARYEADRTSISPMVGRLFAACGLNLHGATRPSGRPVVERGFHSLRHSYITLASSAGISLTVIRKVCGHSSEAIQRNYIHDTEAELFAQFAKMPALFDGADPTEAADRERLRHLAATLPVDKIREILRDLG